MVQGTPYVDAVPYKVRYDGNVCVIVVVEMIEVTKIPGPGAYKPNETVNSKFHVPKGGAFSHSPLKGFDDLGKSPAYTGI